MQLSLQNKTGSAAKIRLLKIICITGLLFSYLYQLGTIPLDVESDESIRAVVSAEMIISKNYITPTINGEVYLNKPPLYNWIVAGYFKVFGNYSMFAFRLQVIVAVFLTGLLIYFFIKKYTNSTIAFFTAFAYMCNGRLLIYESLFGFIDTTFALVVFANMMLIFYFGEKKKYYALFITSYIACALAFLLKGLPALLFQGFSLFVYFIFSKNFKKLFSIQHLAGVAAFAGILLPYYLIYFHQNNYPASVLFGNIYNESAKRTFIQYGITDTIKHFFSFPFEMFYHFLPFTIFLIALLKKNTVHLIKQNRFVQYMVLVFLINIPAYWLSVDVYPKYVFMFVPLVYGIAFYCFFENILLQKSWQAKIIQILMCICSIALTVFALAIPFISSSFNTGYLYFKICFLITAFLFCTYIILTKKQYRLYFFILLPVLVRMGFNWFVLPFRGETAIAAKAASDNIVQITKGKNLFILSDANTGNFDGISFDICTQRNEILKKAINTQPGSYYIVDEKQLHQNNFISDFHFENFPEHNSLYLVHLPALNK